MLTLMRVACARMHICAYAYAYVHMLAHMHMYAYICTHAHASSIFDHFSHLLWNDIADYCFFQAIFSPISSCWAYDCYFFTSFSQSCVCYVILRFISRFSRCFSSHHKKQENNLLRFLVARLRKINQRGLFAWLLPRRSIITRYSPLLGICWEEKINTKCIRRVIGNTTIGRPSGPSNKLKNILWG